MIQTFTTLVAGILIAFFHEWRTSLVALGLLPLMMLAGSLQMALTTKSNAKTDAAYKESSLLIS
jgi:Cu/Ag efflux pump CusA